MVRENIYCLARYWRCFFTQILTAKSPFSQASGSPHLILTASESFPFSTSNRFYGQEASQKTTLKQASRQANSIHPPAALVACSSPVCKVTHRNGEETEESEKQAPKETRLWSSQKLWLPSAANCCSGCKSCQEVTSSSESSGWWWLLSWMLALFWALLSLSLLEFWLLTSGRSGNPNSCACTQTNPAQPWSKTKPHAY